MGFMPPHCVAGQDVLSSGCCLHPTDSTGLQDLPTAQANALAALAARPDSPSQARVCPVSQLLPLLSGMLSPVPQVCCWPDPIVLCRSWCEPVVGAGLRICKVRQHLWGTG